MQSANYLDRTAILMFQRIIRDSFWQSAAHCTMMVVVASMFVVGMFNALHHARDGWHSVGTAGLVMSIVCTALAFAAAFLAYSGTVQSERSA